MYFKTKSMHNKSTPGLIALSVLTMMLLYFPKLAQAHNDFSYRVKRTKQFV